MATAPDPLAPALLRDYPGDKADGKDKWPGRHTDKKR